MFLISPFFKNETRLLRVPISNFQLNNNVPRLMNTMYMMELLVHSAGAQDIIWKYRKDFNTKIERDTKDLVFNSFLDIHMLLSTRNIIALVQSIFKLFYSVFKILQL